MRNTATNDSTTSRTEKTVQPVEKIWARLSDSDKRLFLGHADKTLTEKDAAILRAIIARQTMAQGGARR